MMYGSMIGRTFTDFPNVTFVKTREILVFGYGKEFPFSEEENITTDVGHYSTPSHNNEV